MNESTSICVFCASSGQVAPEYLNIAEETGRLIAAQNWRLVYGGAKIGLMGRLADAAMKGGAEVIGYIPEHMKAYEIAHESITQLHTTKDMHERQRAMMDAADGFIVLPGGLGTLAEFFEVLTWKQIGLHTKPIAMINTAGYWDSILAGIASGSHEGFIREKSQELFEVFDDLTQIVQFFQKD